MYHVLNSYLSCFITLVGVYIFGRIVLNTKPKICKYMFILVFLLSSVIYTYDFINFDGTVKTIIMFLVNVILYKRIFKVTYSRAIILTFMQVIILMIPDILELLFMTKILKLSKGFCYNIFAGSIVGNLSIILLFIIITYLLRKPLRSIVNYKLENNTKIIIYSILTFVCVISFFFTLINQYAKNNEVLPYIVVMIITVAILLSLIRQTIENDKLTKKYEKMLEFVTTYEKEVENQRTSRHETKNAFVNIKSMVVDNLNKKEILKYVDSVLKDDHKMKFEHYAKFQYLPANGIKGFFYFKVQEAESKNITVGINISPKVVKSSIYNLNLKERKDFIKIFGVFIDNAIEASANTKKKQIGIEAYNINGNFQVIISNTYNNEIDLEKMGKEKFSTKGKNRGHGLLLVKNIVENNKIFELETNANDKLYIQYVEIKKTI